MFYVILKNNNFLVKTELVKSFLSTECGVTYTHLNVKGPEEDFKDIKYKPKGLFQRNEGLKWLRQHHRTHKQPSGKIFITELAN